MKDVFVAGAYIPDRYGRVLLARHDLLPELRENVPQLGLDEGETSSVLYELPVADINPRQGYQTQLAAHLKTDYGIDANIKKPVATVLLRHGVDSDLRYIFTLYRASVRNVVRNAFRGRPLATTECDYLHLREVITSEQFSLGRYALELGWRQEDNTLKLV